MRNLFIGLILFGASALNALPVTLPPAPPAIFDCGENLSALVRVAATAQTFTTTSVDTPLIRAQAPWIKASLLLDFKNSFVRPRVPVVATSTASESELQKQSAAVETIYKLRQEQQQVWLAVQDRKTEVAAAAAQIQISINGQKDMHRKVAELSRQVDDLSHASWLCSMGLFCGPDVKDALKNLDGAKSSEAHFAAEQTRLETALEANKLKLGLATKNFIDETQKLKMAGVNTTAEQDLQPGFINQDIARLQTEMQTVSIFIPVDREHRFGSLQRCARPLRYHLGQNLNKEAGLNPLTDQKISPDLTPDASADLEVCVNRADQVQSVHIMQNANEILSSTISANAHGDVTRIKVRNSKGQLLEEREWLNLPNGKIRLKASYYPTDDLSGKPISVYQDQSPERQQ